MKDQAEALRRRSAVSGTRPYDPAATPVFAIGSGKGGVGKSVISVLLADSLARQGRRVLLFDGSQNQGNLHVLLGIQRVGRLSALLDGEASPSDLVIPVGERLSLLPADSGDGAVYALTPTDRARLHHRLSALFDEFDAVVVDAGPGIEGVMRATIRASRLVVVCIPEPASLSDAYAVIKIGTMQVPGLPVDVLVNRAVDENEVAATFDRLRLASERFLMREIALLGFVPEDETLREKVRVPGRLLEAGADAGIHAHVRSLATVLMERQGSMADAP